jgi:hypothetical protein
LIDNEECTCKDASEEEIVEMEELEVEENYIEGSLEQEEQ